MNENGIEGQSGGYGNFVCVKIPKHLNTKDVCEELGKQSIYIRDISGRLP